MTQPRPFLCGIPWRKKLALWRRYDQPGLYYSYDVITFKPHTAANHLVKVSQFGNDRTLHDYMERTIKMSLWSPNDYGDCNLPKFVTSCPLHRL